MSDIRHRWMTGIGHHQEVGQAHSINLFHPTRNPRPILFERPPPDEQTQMIARGDLAAEILRLRSDQPLHCKQLFRGNYFVGASGEKIYWKIKAREVDLLPQGDEGSTGEFVAFV